MAAINKKILTTILGGLLIAFFTGGCYSIKLQGKKFHPVTKDGWKLTIEHFPPAPGAPRRKYPVLFAHGMIANRKYLKLNEESSVVNLLRKAGYDVWLMDYRGREDAGSPGYFWGEHTYTYSVDDYIKYDMDRGLKFVLKKTGAEKVNWLGHSTGGIIAYARLGTTDENRIANLVTFGSPGMFIPLNKSYYRWYRLRGGMAVIPVVAGTPFARIDAYTGIPVVPHHIPEMLYNTENTHPAMARKLHALGTNNLSKPVARQFLNSLRKGRMLSKDGKTDYSASVKNIQVPMLLIAGRVDNMVDPMTVKYVYDEAASDDKTYLVFGRNQGHRHDYGHTDLLIGPEAATEVLPPVIQWLNARNGGEKQ